ALLALVQLCCGAAGWVDHVRSSQTNTTKLIIQVSLCQPVKLIRWCWGKDGGIDVQGIAQISRSGRAGESLRLRQHAGPAKVRAPGGAEWAGGGTRDAVRTWCVDARAAARRAWPASLAKAVRERAAPTPIDPRLSQVRSCREATQARRDRYVE